MFTVTRHQHDRRHGRKGQLAEKGSASALFMLQEVTGLPVMAPNLEMKSVVTQDLRTKLVNETAAEFGLTLTNPEIQSLLHVINTNTVNDWLVWWKMRAKDERKLKLR